MDDFEKNEDTDRFRKLEAERKKIVQNTSPVMSILPPLTRRIVERRKNKLRGAGPVRSPNFNQEIAP